MDMSENLTERINIELDDLAKEALMGRTTAEISRRVADEFMRKPEFQDMINSIKIDLNDIRKRVEYELVERIIRKWAEDMTNE